MYLLSRKIKALGFKVVMSGEGADEVFGGYLYFHKAPNAAEFHRYGLTLGFWLYIGNLCQVVSQTVGKAVLLLA